MVLLELFPDQAGWKGAQWYSLVFVMVKITIVFVCVTCEDTPNTNEHMLHQSEYNRRVMHICYAGII